MNILIVDSDPLFTSAISVILRNEGYYVAIARDGKQAATALAADRYGLVIIDMLMSYNNGLEIVANIRQDMMTKNTPIIVVSSISNEQSLLNWKFVGASSYMEKPLNISFLLQKITELSKKRTVHAA